ncbi:Uncharacterised protein [Segatella copri]|nr:Uncharacterised protein [Segatella copri]
MDIETHIATSLPNFAELFHRFIVILQLITQFGFYNFMLFKLLATRVHYFKIMIQLNILRHTIMYDMHMVQKILLEFVHINLIFTYYFL